MKYLLFGLLFLAACSSRKERLQEEWNGYKQQLDVLNQQRKLQSDSFRQNRSLSADSAFRKRVEILANEIQALQSKMDKIDLELKELNKDKNKEEEEEAG